MGFILSQSPTYVWPVEIRLPADGGQFTKHTFDAEFARLPQSEIEGMLDSIVSGDANDREVCKKIVKGWKGITDAEGAEIPFSATKLDEVLEIPTVAMSMIKSWMESITGAKAKN